MLTIIFLTFYFHRPFNLWIDKKLLVSRIVPPHPQVDNIPYPNTKIYDVLKIYRESKFLQLYHDILFRKSDVKIYLLWCVCIDNFPRVPRVEFSLFCCLANNSCANLVWKMGKSDKIYHETMLTFDYVTIVNKLSSLFCIFDTCINGQSNENNHDKDLFTGRTVCLSKRRIFFCPKQNR